MSGAAPEVFTTIVDDEYLDTLFNEVDRGCSDLVIRLRGSGEREAGSAEVTLAEARGALKTGAGVQLRYRHDGIAWSDTLHPTTHGVQLIRCQLPVG